MRKRSSRRPGSWLDSDARMMIRQLQIDQAVAGQRLDLFLASHLDSDRSLEAKLSRAEIQKLISRGQVTLNGAAAKPSVRLKLHDRVDVQTLPQRQTALRAEPLALDILYEDQDCLVVNKAAGMVVHPAAGQTSGTLVNGLLQCCPQSLWRGRRFTSWHRSSIGQGYFRSDDCRQEPTSLAPSCRAI